MKKFALLAAVALALAACGTTNKCPSGYADPNWCNQPPSGGDGSASVKAPVKHPIVQKMNR